METKELEKSTRHWPALLGDGWLDRFFNTPLDEYFSLSRVVPSVKKRRKKRENITTEENTTTVVGPEVLVCQKIAIGI
jgi:hypothetical protein